MIQIHFRKNDKKKTISNKIFFLFSVKSIKNKWFFRQSYISKCFFNYVPHLLNYIWNEIFGVCISPPVFNVLIIQIILIHFFPAIKDFFCFDFFQRQMHWTFTFPTHQSHVLPIKNFYQSHFFFVFVFCHLIFLIGNHVYQHQKIFLNEFVIISLLSRHSSRHKWRD